MLRNFSGSEKVMNGLGIDSSDEDIFSPVPTKTELLSNVVYSKLTLGGFPAVDCAFINTVDELHAGNHISELPEST